MTLNIETRTLDAGLYLVSTPIGNLRDISLRALDVLSGVNTILCEDTRHTGKLLQAYDIQKPTRSYHDHSNEEARNWVIRQIQNGKALALVSDAGTPLISDPGFKLVRACVENDLKIVPLPGANAVLPALQLSGLRSDTFTFIGFLPNKNEARNKFLKRFQHYETTLLFYETGPRLVGALKSCRDVLGNRQACVTREISKIYEDVQRGDLGKLIERYENSDAPKGEIVVAIDRAPQNEINDEDVKELLVKAMKDASLKQAVSEVVDATGKRKKDVYEMALTIKDEQ